MAALVDAPQVADASAVVLQAAYSRPYRELCPRWPRGELLPGFGRIEPSPAPVLAFSGGIDPATPPRHAERAVAALGPKARHVVAPHLGHGVMTGACGRELLQGFIDAETDVAALAIDAGCLARLPRPPAFEPPAGSAGRADIATKGSAR
jgi:pimeloyl-ACP methyl ester carboxylesterase